MHFTQPLTPSKPQAYPGFYNGGGSRGGRLGQGVLETEVPQWGPEAKPPRSGRKM